MRASPPFLVTVCRFGWWRVCVGGVMAAALAALATWAVAGERPSGLVLLGVAAGSLPLLAGAASLLRRGAFTLRWDGQTWRLNHGMGADENAPAGDLSVAIDLGAWMLLKFDRPPGRFGRHATWLPVQRRGLEAQWHAFRCAVYSPRPAAGRDKDHAALPSRSRAQSHA